MFIIIEKFTLLTEEETLKKLNILGIYDPRQLEEKDLNMWWHKKYLDIRDSQIKKETINEKLNEINQIVLELSKRKKWKLIEILLKSSINEKEEILKKLEILSISSSDQLEKNKLDFWWQKKYKEIKDSQLKEETIKEKLMEINEIYEDLSKVDEKLLFEIINKKSNEENIVDSDLDLYNQGLEHYKQNEYEKSIKKFSEAIHLKSDNPDYFNLRGWAYYALNKYEKALKNAGEAIALNSNEPEYFYFRGLVYYELKKYEKALNDANKAIKLNPDEPEYFNFKKEIEDTKRAFEADLLNRLSLTHFHQKRYEEAIEINNMAIELNPNNPEYLNLRKAIEDAIKVNESDCSNLEKIKKYFDNKDYERTIIQCNEAINSNETIADYYFYRGLSKQYSNKVYKNNSILNDFNIAIELNPDNPYIWSRRGSLKVEIDYNGNYIESAISDTSRAIEINSTKAEFYYRSGHAKCVNDQIEEGLYDLNKAIKLDPRNKEGYLNHCQNLIESINEFSKESDWGYVFLAKCPISPDKYRIGTTTYKGELKRKVGKDSLVITSAQCKGYKHLAIVIYRRYKKNRIGNSEYFLLDDCKYNQVITTITRSYAREDEYGSGFLSEFFIE